MMLLIGMVLGMVMYPLVEEHILPKLKDLKDKIFK